MSSIILATNRVVTGLGTNFSEGATNGREYGWDWDEAALRTSKIQWIFTMLKYTAACAVQFALYEWVTELFDTKIRVKAFAFCLFCMQLAVAWIPLLTILVKGNFLRT